MTTKSSVSDFGRDHGLIHEAVVTSRKAGWTAAEWSRLAHSEETMRNVRKFLLGHAEIVTLEHLMDCDADPFVPDRWSLEEHQKGGLFKWNAANVALHLDMGQKDGKSIKGNKLHKALAGKRVLNANVLDHLLANQHLIPEEWKGAFIFFWGTIYRGRDGRLCVRYLGWSGGRWRWRARWLDSDWGGNRPAAVPAS